MIFDDLHCMLQVRFVEIYTCSSAKMLQLKYGRRKYLDIMKLGFKWFLFGQNCSEGLGSIGLF